MPYSLETKISWWNIGTSTYIVNTYGCLQITCFANHHSIYKAIDRHITWLFVHPCYVLEELQKIPERGGLCAKLDFFGGWGGVG